MQNDLIGVTKEERMESLVIKAVLIGFATFVMTIGSCTMHSNAYESDTTKAEAILVTEKAKLAKIEATVKIEKIKSEERLISEGTSPIALRCMDVGWKNDGSGTCMAIGMRGEPE